MWWRHSSVSKLLVWFEAENEISMRQEIVNEFQLLEIMYYDNRNKIELKFFLSRCTLQNKAKISVHYVQYHYCMPLPTNSSLPYCSCPCFLQWWQCYTANPPTRQYHHHFKCSGINHMQNSHLVVHPQKFKRLGSYKQCNISRLKTSLSKKIGSNSQQLITCKAPKIRSI